MPTRKPTKKSTKPAKKAPGFTAEEKAALRERAQEVRAAARGENGPDAVLAKIAAMKGLDRTMAQRLHTLITTSAPGLAPRLWYGMPAYAKEGKVVCFFQDALKFKARYATLGFSDKANLDEGPMWPTAFALTSLGPAEEAKIAALVKRAVG
jgi:uncharacterized protein YdhG (YjbR/CyaY superfamily)